MSGNVVALDDGSVLLDDIEHFLQRFVVYPSDATRVAHVLWIAHAHRMDLWESTPRIAFLSPEPGSGKSRALEVMELLVPRPIHAVNATPAYLFRKVADEAGAPTILFDEVDAIFGARARENEDVRAMLNAGHRKGVSAGRCVVKGKTVETEELPAFCAVALAGLGDLPATLMARSVVVRMRRRAPSEHVEPFRHRIHAPEGHALRERLGRWTRTMPAGVWPTLPAGIEDRSGDCWEALLAVADAAGGDWPERARVAAVAVVADGKTETPSLGVRLLHDLRSVFSNRDRLATEDILSALVAIDEAPWGDLRGKPLDARGLSRYLAKYDVHPRNLRVADRVVKGYERSDLVDSWARYTSRVADNNLGEGGGNMTNLVGNSTVGPSSQDAATAATPLHEPGIAGADAAPPPPDDSPPWTDDDFARIFATEEAS